MFAELLTETKKVSEAEDSGKKTEYVKLSDLLPCPYNRKIDKAKVEDIKNKIKDTGVVKPFVVTEIGSDNGNQLMITDGHHRYLALKDLIKDGDYKEDSKVPVVVSDEQGTKTADAEKPKEVKESQSSHSKCMKCDAPPTKEVLWAEGMGHAWFCDKHFKDWSTKGDGKGDICSVKAVKDGKAASKFADNKNPNIMKEAKSDTPWADKGAKLTSHGWEQLKGTQSKWKAPSGREYSTAWLNAQPKKEFEELLAREKI